MKNKILRGLTWYLSASVMLATFCLSLRLIYATQGEFYGWFEKTNHFNLWWLSRQVWSFVDIPLSVLWYALASFIAEAFDKPEWEAEKNGDS